MKTSRSLGFRKMRPVSALGVLLSFPLLVLLLEGCGDAGRDPSAPEESEGSSMLGSVALLAPLTDEAGETMGTDRILNANGIRVYCRHEDGGIDSVPTDAGRFLFKGIPAGACTVYVEGPDARRADEVFFAMPNHDCAIAEILEIAPEGDLSIHPNPFGEEGAAIEFSKSGAGPYRVSVLELSGEVVWSYEQETPPGLYHVHWIATDQGGEPVEPGPYWVRVEKDGESAYGVALRSGGESEPDSGNCGHVHAEGVAITEGELVLAIQTEEGVDGELAVGAGSERSARFQFMEEDGSLYAVADTCPENGLEWEVADTTIATISREPGTIWGLRIEGRATGLTSVRFSVIHEEHAHIVTLPFPIRVS